MKYYLVALFDKDSYENIEILQRQFTKKYRLYRNLPILHITLEVVDNPDIDKLIKIIEDILKPYKKFKVELNGALCFDAPYKAVNLKTENKGYIMRLERLINDTLKINGFKVRSSINDWDLHMSLSSSNFSEREWTNKDYMTACVNAKKENVYRMAKIDRIELWKSVNNKREMVVKSFKLRDF